jgi:hypothetical protein
MKINKRIKLLIAFNVLAVVIGTTLVINLTSCSANKYDDDPCDYVGNQDGSNWETTGFAGSISITFSNENDTATITKGFTEVSNLIIPKYVIRDGDQKTFVIDTIAGSGFYGSTLVGSLTIPNTIQTTGSEAFSDLRNMKCAVNELIFNYESLSNLQYDDRSFNSDFGQYFFHPTVKNLNPKVFSEAMLMFFKKGLPDRWIAA